MKQQRLSSLFLMSLLSFGCSQNGEDGQSVDASGGAANLPVPNCKPPSEMGVRIVGRHDGCVAGTVQMSWSGTGFVARFSGPGIRFTQSSSPLRYKVIVDGEEREDLVTENGEKTYDLVNGLSDGEHVIEVYRQSEASFGTASLRSVQAVGGELLEPPEAPVRRIEIFGDSVTTGYGNEGEVASCPFSLETQNHYLSYGALMARGFDAELSTVAFSGRGVVSNYDGQGGETVPELADRAVAALASSVWDYRLAAQPDLVVINLGTNDYSTESDPSDEDFVVGYVGLLELIRDRYPQTEILGTVGPLLFGTDLATARTNIEAAVQVRRDAGDDKVRAVTIADENPSPGCDYHPDLATHARMADELGAIAADVLGWDYSTAAN